MDPEWAREQALLESASSVPVLSYFVNPNPNPNPRPRDQSRAAQVIGRPPEVAICHVQERSSDRNPV